MSRRFQEGGLAAVSPPSEDVTPTLLQLLTQQYTTSPEAQQEAREILERYQSGEPFAAEEELLGKFRETAESSRQALREAREKVLGRKRDPSAMWFRLAQAFGRPTQTGAFGETLGFVGEALADERAARSEGAQQQQMQLLELDQALAGVDQNLLQNELALASARRKAEADLAQRALGTLGKTPVGLSATDPRAAAAKALDSAYIKEYVPFITGGSADAAKGLEELAIAVKTLRGGSRYLTGPIVGSISTLPWIGKPTQDILWPKGTDVREMVETSVQRSLRPILGSQFTAQEGQRLIERVYNPRIPEPLIAARVERLAQSLERAYREKVRAAEYFEKKGTLTGFQGKVDWALSDFLLGDQDVKMPDGSIIQVPEGTTREQAIRIWREKPKKAKGGRIRKVAKKLREKDPVYQDLRRLYKEVDDPELKKRLKNYLAKKKTAEFAQRQAYQEGGEVGLAEPLTLDDLPSEDSQELENLLSEGLIGAGVGATAGAAAADVGTRLQGALEGVRSTRGDRKIVGGMQAADEDIEALGAEVKRARRQGVPTTLMDLGRGTRIVGQEALTQGSELADETIEEMEDRIEQSRERVAERINKSLKPYPYFEHTDRLTSDLYENARPLYEEAYRAHPGISIQDVPALRQIMESPDGKRAIKMAIRLLRNQGKTVGKKDAVGMVRKPSLEFLDYVKRGFDQIISKEEAQGSTPLGRSMRELRNNLRSQLDLVSDEYTAARAQYAGDLEVLDALRSGREEFMRITPEEVRREVAEMTPAEHRAYRTGVAQVLYDTIHRPTSDINAARRVIGSPATRDKLKLLFTRQREARIFEEALRREMRLFDRLRKLKRRGETGREQRIAGEIVSDHPMRHAGTFSLSPLMGALRILLNPRPLTSKQADEIIKTLNRGTPKEIDEVVKRLSPLMRQQDRLKRRRSRAAKVGAAVGAVTAPFVHEEIDTEN